MTPGAGSGLCSLLSLQEWFSVKREADYVPEGQLVVLVDAAGCHSQGACFWPLGGGGQRCCSTGCNTRDSPLPSLSCPPHPAPTDNKERCRSQRQAGSLQRGQQPHQSLLIRSSGHLVRSPSAVQTEAAQPRWLDSAASKSPVFTRAAVSTAAVHSHPAKAEAARLTRAVAEGKATGSGTCGQTHFLYSQGFFQDPCCVKTTPPLPTHRRSPLKRW